MQRIKFKLTFALLFSIFLSSFALNSAMAQETAQQCGDTTRILWADANDPTDDIEAIDCSGEQTVELYGQQMDRTSLTHPVEIVQQPVFEDPEPDPTPPVVIIPQTTCEQKKSHGGKNAAYANAEVAPGGDDCHHGGGHKGEHDEDETENGSKIKGPKGKSKKGGEKNSNSPAPREAPKQENNKNGSPK